MRDEAQEQRGGEEVVTAGRTTTTMTVIARELTPSPQVGFLSPPSTVAFDTWLIDLARRTSTLLVSTIVSISTDV
jgi:hypothetical protein